MLTSLASALLLLAAQDAPVATSPTAAPAAQPAPPAAEPPARATGDYTYVAECFGSLSGFIDARPKVWSEVERIEGTWVGRIGQTTAAEAMAGYQQTLTQAEQDQAVIRRALTAAQGASPANLVTAGQAATASARAKWDIGNVNLLAREWMSWTLPARCLREASVLEQRSTFNAALLRGAAQPAAPAPAEAPAQPPAEAASPTP